MDFRLSDEQAMLRDSAARYVEHGYRFEHRHQIVEQGGFSLVHWQQFGAMGWLGIALPESVGGIGGNAVDNAVLLEQLGRGLLLEPVVPVAVLAAQLLWRAGSAAQHDAWLPALAAGERLLLPALREGGGAIATTAERIGAGWRITGRKTVLPAAAWADAFIVSAREGDRITLFILPRDTSGLRREDYRLIDGSAASDLVLDGVLVGVDAELAGGAQAIEHAKAQALVASCAQALGVMDRALQTTREYLLQRRQFDVPIASFQVLRHAIADMLIAHEQARAMVHRGLAALSLADAAARARELALVRSLVGRSGRFIGAQAIQLHGGIGMTDEYVVGHCLKSLMVLETLAA